MKPVLVALLALAAAGCSLSKNAPSPADNPGGGVRQIGTQADLGASAPAAEEAEPSATAEATPRHRQGLGTEFGESRNSAVTSVPFARDSNTPDVTLALNYDDLEGVRALLQQAGSGARTESTIATDDGTFVLTVVDGNGELLPAAELGNRRFAVGSAGQRYSLGIENHSDQRFEVVASVDGLDVIDGEEAGFNKRGYVLEPFSSVMVDGWRTSDETVAAFRFGTVADSYADRKGKGRNVGVIGAAFFHERGGVAWRDLGRAEPFPSRFAAPPPARRF